MMHHLKISCLIAFCFIAGVTCGQKEYARKVVDTLASPYMAGRGYVDDGNKKAAVYLVNEFKNLGILAFDNNYKQKFEYSVNTYPHAIRISIDTIKISHGADFGAIVISGDRENRYRRRQENGIDYIVMPSTPSIKGEYPVVRVDRSILSDSVKLKAFASRDYSKTFILMDDSGVTDKKEKAVWEELETPPNQGGVNKFKAKGIIVLCNKLTEETSQSVGDYAVLNALRTSYFRYANSIEIEVKNKFISNFKTENVIGYLKGTQQPDTFIVFSAHYDHLGRMGNIYFPGANDNASGVAMLLSLAKYYAQHKDSLKYSVAFMAFTGEEIGVLGSKYYTEHPLFPLSKIRFLINMDIMGTGDEGITVVNGAIYDAPFQDLLKINEKFHLLKQIKPRGATANSDHYFFYLKHVPSFFIYTMGGIKAYHDIYDRRETLPLTNFNDVFQLLIHFTDDICRHQF